MAGFRNSARRALFHAPALRRLRRMSDPAGIPSARRCDPMIFHSCEAKHVATEHVIEKHEGKTVWSGDIEVFDLRRPPEGEARVRVE